MRKFAYIAFLTLLLTPTSAGASVLYGNLPRVADLGIQWGRTKSEELMVTSTTPRSAANRAGLKAEDIVRRIGPVPIRRGDLHWSAVAKVKGGQVVDLQVERAGQLMSIRFRPPPAPIERFAGLEVEYGDLRTSDGLRLRTIITQPKQRVARLPAIYFVEWLSCDPVDTALADDDGWSRMLRGLVVRSGMVVWRTEKAGIGDSQGNCEELDWETEVQHHREALAALRKHPSVDPDRIFIFGSSIGARMAPILAHDFDPAGIAVWGGGSTSWFEYVLGHNRTFGLARGVAPSQLGSTLLQQASVLSEVLARGHSPAELSPADRQIWAGMPRVHPTTGKLYGRSHRWHQQAALANWPEAWLRTRAPVLITYGAFDRFDTLASVNWTAEIVNSRVPGKAHVVILPNYNHHFTMFRNQDEADKNLNGNADPGPFLDLLISWFRQQLVPPSDRSIK